ncbi:MAG: serine/threonine protein kinase [Phycisphaerales bacterium]|nr:serine/threonine protein kinase [Phycisphaerales bacterium]
MDHHQQREHHGPSENVTSDAPTGLAGVRHTRSPSSPGPAVGRFAPGEVLLHRYRLVVSLGRGGMGEVYRADDLELGQSVALKFLPAEVAADTARLAMLRAEVASARQIAHTNVCRVFDICRAETSEGPLAFLCMEYVDGSDLASLLTRIGRFPGEKAADVARQICFGLAAVHDAGFLHRDLKPGNILLDGRGRPRLADFGLAAPHDTEFRGIAGTPEYTAPEVARGERPSRRSDIYSLGLILYELFTGRAATPDVESFDDLRRRLDTPDFQPARPSTLVGDLAPGVEQAILACLDPDPAQRPPSAIAVAARLPGSDPLAAALAAGETPSPELVAASGPRGGLSIGAAALMLLGIVAAALTTIAVTAPRSLLAWARPAKSVEVLTDRARELIGTLGFEQNPVDWHSAVSIRQSLLDQAKGLPADKLRPVFAGFPGAYVFWYRQSVAPLEPDDISRILRAYQPAHVHPGDLVVQMDTQGRLDRLQAVPPVYSEPNPHAPADPIPFLFEAAGLDRTRFEKIPPQRRCPVDADQTLAWKGPARPDSVPVHLGPDAATVVVHAGLADGQAVFFSVDEAGAGPNIFEKPPPRPAASERNISIGFGVLISVLTAGFLVMAVRNLRSGRGDPRGATRASLVMLALGVVYCLCLYDRQPSPMELFFTGAGYSPILWSIAQFWLFYVAMEPAVRRLWPHTLITWSRLVAGRVRDPAVGRDVLTGLVFGGGAAAATLGLVLLGQTLLGQQPRPPVKGGVLTYTLAQSVGDAAARLLTAVMYASCGMFSLVLGRILLKSTPLAMLFALILLAATIVPFMSSDPAQAASMFLMLGVIALSQIRTGFLCGVAAMVAAHALVRFNIGWDWSAPWGIAPWAPAALLATLAIWAAWVATSDHRRAPIA